MFKKARVVIICLLLIQQICQSNSKTLPTTTKDGNDGSELKNPTTTYYRHNIFGPNTYAFGFEVNDKDSGNIQFRDERRYANGTTQGSYGYVRPDGNVMVTHFLADKERGYLSQTQNFEPGNKQNWPTKKPNIIMDKPLESLQPTIVYDDKEKLNLTSVLLPVEPIKKEHGIDLNPAQLEKELVNPAVLEVINGEAPLIADPKKKDQASLGFETVNKFIPPQFPIVPFQLPQDDVEIKLNGGLSAKPIPVMQPVKGNKYEEQKLNNSEKTLNPPDSGSSANNKYIKSQGNNAEKSLPSAAIKSQGNNIEKSLPSATIKSQGNNSDKSLPSVAIKSQGNNAEKSLPSAAIKSQGNNAEKSLPSKAIKSQGNNAEKSLPSKAIKSQGNNAEKSLPSAAIKSQGNNIEKSLPSASIKSQGNNSDKSLPSVTIKSQGNNAEKSLPSAAIKSQENNAEKSLPFAAIKSQGNNAEKSLPSSAIEPSVNNEHHFMRSRQAKSILFDKNIDWYDKVIKQTRQQYLETVL